MSLQLYFENYCFYHLLVQREKRLDRQKSFVSPKGLQAMFHNQTAGCTAVLI